MLAQAVLAAVFAVGQPQSQSNQESSARVLLSGARLPLTVEKTGSANRESLSPYFDRLKLPPFKKSRVTVHFSREWNQLYLYPRVNVLLSLFI